MIKLFPCQVTGFLTASGLLVCSFAGVDAEAETFPKFDRYRDCVREISIDARQAYDRASRWRTSGGGASAMHCEALALSALGVYPSAAKLLVRIAKLSEIEDPKRKADLYDQAGHAWLLAGEADRAIKTFSAGLDHVNLKAAPLAASQLRIGRARAYGLQEEWPKAIAELDAILAALPQHDEAILLRASMYRGSGDLAACAEDLANYLTLWPNDPNGLLERGFLKMDVLNMAGAKADFERVVEILPESPAAARAQTALGKIAFREESRSGGLTGDRAGDRAGDPASDPAGD